jgi:hypothetical protein
MTSLSSRSDGLGEAFQANWLPIAMIGVGVAWLLAANTGLTERVAQDQRVQTARRRLSEIAGAGSRPPIVGAQIVGPSGEPVARDSEAGWVHQAAGAARGAISSVRDAGSAVLDRAGNITAYAGDAGKRASEQLAETLERDPWLIGVFGFVAGALLAALLPPTQVEEQFLGEAQARLRSRVTEIGHDAAEQVRELADTAIRESRR